MTNFISPQPTLEEYWRAIILFGKNSASYKFSLAKTLLDFAPQGKTTLKWDDLAVPFSRHISEHLRTADRQGTSSSSQFLRACRNFNEGLISKDELINETVKRGFTNVIEAFHTVGNEPINTRFFEGDRRKNPGIVLTDNLYRLLEGEQRDSLPHEVEARWRLVESSWGLDLSEHLISVEYASNDSGILRSNLKLGRVTVTSCRDALNGYQKGKCFYCFNNISISSISPNLCDVDHFLPFVLAKERILVGLNGIWNLVLSCQSCNRGQNGKFDRIPAIKYLKRLHRRNEFFIGSHHPLRETLMSQTGLKTDARGKFLQENYKTAKQHLIHEWTVKHEIQPASF
ncbi:HNH endonuclease domain-containing protein [Nodosilinea sp. FACHB-13]|uniref:HNH endonuclease domain-containing protein n=1 Tax=Cyanophyceae TaxID=3028117 RepID=UPI0016896DA5|nr:HNH endonuclease domain-containing protein [Nodosilinea sp. FACHB-13]MBD2110009.1 HNH endonuclease [Nodosilinea sp. FACHB-13]